MTTLAFSPTVRFCSSPSSSLMSTLTSEVALEASASGWNKKDTRPQLKISIGLEVHDERWPLWRHDQIILVVVMGGKGVSEAIRSQCSKYCWLRRTKEQMTDQNDTGWLQMCSKWGLSQMRLHEKKLKRLRFRNVSTLLGNPKQAIG